MRITFVGPTADFSGGCRVLATYARRLRDRGHQVQVVTRATYRPLRKQLRELLLGKPSRVMPSRPGPANHYEVLGVPLSVVSGNRKLRPWDVQDADVIIASWWETAEWIADFPPSKGAKAYFIQGNEAHLPNQPRVRVEATWRLPYHKITISSYLSELAREFGDDDVTLVPNAVDGAQFDAPPRDKNPTPVIGVVYAKPWLKGFDVARRVVAEVARNYPDLRVVAFGHENPDEALPLPDNTAFVRQPPQDQIRDLYARCDVWLTTSRVEGFGLPMLEAMACRCPVVATRVGAAPDIVTPGTNGFIAEIDDVAGLTQAVERVLALDPAAWRRMSDAAHAFAHGYDWDRATERFHAGLERAIVKQRRDRRPEQSA